MALKFKFGHIRQLQSVSNVCDVTRLQCIHKRNRAHLVDYAIKSPYEIPENVMNCFHVANASLWDNMLFYFHNGVQISYRDILNDLKQVHPTISDTRAAKTIDSIIKALNSCKNCIEFTYPLEKENGKVDIITAYRVQHTLYRQPCIGGVRICEKISANDLKGLATLITFQNANLNLPFGGSFGGIAINPNHYSARNLRRIVTRYTIECAKHGFLDPAKDVFQPDLNISSREMNWMTDAFQQTIGHNNVNSYAALLGKPANRKGLQNYNESAAHAVYCALSHIFMDNEKMSALNLTANWSDKTFVVHGFGRVGRSIAECFYNTGAKCVGIQDGESMVIFNADGLNVPDLIKHYNKHKTLLDYPDGQEYQSDLIAYCADILVLAGSHKTIHCFNVQSITSKIIVEAAFCAITPTAHKTLVSKNVLVLPDIQVATGSQIAAYMEYLKNINHISFGQIGKEPVRTTGKKAEDIEAAVAEATGETVTSTAETVTNQIPIMRPNKLQMNCDFNEGEIVKNVVETNIIRTNEEINETCERYGLGMDLRMACYVCAIRRLMNAYLDTGKFDNHLYDEQSNE